VQQALNRCNHVAGKRVLGAPEDFKLTGKHAHPGTSAGHRRLASELTLALASTRPGLPAVNPAVTTGATVSDGQLIAPGWRVPSESNSATSARTFARRYTRREINGRFPGQALVT